jgi:prepilin-type N-terminal cleavage/methylation domain-containing protein
MNKSCTGFTLVELVFAMFIAGVFLYLLGSMTRHMVASVDTEQQMMTVEQDVRQIHEYVGRLVRDASLASIQIGGGCGLMQFNTMTFGGTTNLSHHFYLAGATFNELYEEADFNCSDGNLLTDYYDSQGSQITFDGNYIEWSMSLTDGVDTIPVRIVATPRNL